MYKLFFLILVVSITGCRTAINPVVKTTAPRSHLPSGLVKIIEKDAGPATVKVMSPLSQEEKNELSNRYFRSDSATDVEIVSGDEYDCKSDWICAEHAGAWSCYCKAVKVKKP